MWLLENFCYIKLHENARKTYFWLLLHRAIIIKKHHFPRTVGEFLLYKGRGDFTMKLNGMPPPWAMLWHMTLEEGVTVATLYDTMDTRCWPLRGRGRDTTYVVHQLTVPKFGGDISKKRQRRYFRDYFGVGAENFWPVTRGPPIVVMLSWLEVNVALSHYWPSLAVVIEIPFVLSQATPYRLQRLKNPLPSVQSLQRKPCK